MKRHGAAVSVFRENAYFRSFTRGAGHQLAPAVAEIPRPAQIGVFHPAWIIVWCVKTAVVRYDALTIGLAFAGDLAGKAGQY
jgi:hypothetical protein